MLGFAAFLLCVTYYGYAAAELRCGVIKYDSVCKTDQAPAEAGQSTGNGYHAVILITWFLEIVYIFSFFQLSGLHLDGRIVILWYSWSGIICNMIAG